MLVVLCCERSTPPALQNNPQLGLSIYTHTHIYIYTQRNPSTPPGTHPRPCSPPAGSADSTSNNLYGTGPSDSRSPPQRRRTHAGEMVGLGRAPHRHLVGKRLEDVRAAWACRRGMWADPCGRLVVCCHGGSPARRAGAMLALANFALAGPARGGWRAGCGAVRLRVEACFDDWSGSAATRLPFPERPA
jgi:hypothetical protein